MTLFAIGDLHLPGGEEKPMDIFGDHWENHFAHIAADWRARVKDGDVVLIPGDISWAMQLERAVPDLQKIGALPGRKVLIKGNHDYWWNTVSKMKRMTDNAFEFIFNSALSVENIALAGTRGWIPETSKKITEEDKVIILREQGRLERSLIEAEKFNCEKIFAILHYPPFDEQRRPTKMMEIMKSHGVTDCIYGHIHGKQNFNNLPKELEGIQLHLTSSDYLDFKPLLLTEWNES